MRIDKSILNGIFNLRFSLKTKIDYVTKNLHDVMKDQRYSIDEITANDLMINDFIAEYDKCVTTCGSDLFNHWAYSIKSEDNIKAIQKDMINLQESGNSFAIRNTLKKYAGKQKKGCFVRDLWNGFSINSWIINHFYLLFVLNIALNVGLSVLTSIFIPNMYILFVILFLIINLVLFLLTNKFIYHVTSSLGYFFSLCKSIKKITKKYKLELSIDIPDYKKFKKIVKYSVFFKEGFGGPGSGDILSIFFDYLRIFFCLELYSFKRVQKIVLDNLSEVRKIYNYVGYIDCLINNLIIMEENECSFTEFGEKINIDFKEIHHPLLENAKGQSKFIEKNIIITGLNMSGKTTFMKALGLNQVIATSFGFVFAKEYKTTVLNVISSLCINDELLNGKSRYYAEAQRLLDMKTSIEKNHCLCLIDEILSGTNSDERIEGSIKILLKFGKNESIIVAATHDTAIAENLNGVFEPVYFDGEIEGDKIVFDYIIKDGIVSKKNGLLILKILDI